MINSGGATLVRTRPLTGLLSLWNSTVGKKYVMAVSGFILWGYVVLHLWGNLRIYVSPQALNNWGVFLRVFGAPAFEYEQVLWIVRAILAVALVLHVLSAFQLWRRDVAARPVGYAEKKNLESTYASRTMRWGGIIILLFIIYHVLDLTTGTVHAGTFREGQIYSNVLSGFQHWYVSAIYIVAVTALGFHLYHGIWSMFQTLGWNGPRWNAFWRGVAAVVSFLLTVGNISIPVLVLAGYFH